MRMAGLARPLSRASLRHPLLSRFSAYRSLGTAPAEDDEPKPEKTNAVFSFAESTLRGVGQVVFVNSPTSGLIILGGLAIGDPYLSALAAAGTISATGAATAASLDEGALKDGLWGYNGCLVGCAAAVFMYPLPESSLVMEHVLPGLTATVVGGAATPFVAAALKPAMGSVPQWTLAFNFVTLTTLLRTQPFAGTLPSTPSPVSTTDQLAEIAMKAPFKGISQIFVVDSTLAGAVLLSGMALYSPGLAAHTILGASVGAATGVALGADAADIGMGLWGFNSALTSAAVGVFFCNSPKTVALSAGGAAATAALFGALSSVFGAWNAPCLTLPFCITMSGCYMLHTIVPGLVLASNPHSPEKNVP